MFSDGIVFPQIFTDEQHSSASSLISVTDVYIKKDPKLVGII